MCAHRLRRVVRCGQSRHPTASQQPCRQSFLRRSGICLDRAPGVSLDRSAHMVHCLSFLLSVHGVSGACLLCSSIPRNRTSAPLIAIVIWLPGHTPYIERQQPDVRQAVSGVAFPNWLSAFAGRLSVGMEYTAAAHAASRTPRYRLSTIDR